MDILYYSNYCKHSQKVIQFIVKNNLSEKINCICIDKRKRDPINNQLIVALENGKTIVLPPNIHSVPSLLLVNDKYRVVLGEDIIQHFEPTVVEQQNEATGYNGEPMAFQLNNSWNNGGIVSENYTFYNMTPDELSAKGKGGMRQMSNYVKATHDPFFINTPPDTYRPDKISNNVTIDTLQQKRNEDIAIGENSSANSQNYVSSYS
jgi:hypothetical protein